MSSLKNIQAIREMLGGEHKSQNKIQVNKGESIDGTLKDILRKLKPGEFYTDDSGKLYEKLKSGGHISHGKLWESRKKESLFENCPNHDQSLEEKSIREKLDMQPCISKYKASKLDYKMKGIYGTCLDCRLKKETQMRIDGTWEKYEKDMMKKNSLAWLDEAEKEKDAVIQALTSAEFVNSTGLVEKWDSNVTLEQIEKKIEEEFKFFKEEYLKQFE